MYKKKSMMYRIYFWRTEKIYCKRKGEMTKRKRKITLDNWNDAYVIADNAVAGCGNNNDKR